MKLINILISLTECIFASGLNESLLKSIHPPGITEIDSTTLREIAKYLKPVDTQAFSATSQDLNEWSRSLVLKKAKNFEHLDREASWKLVFSLRAEIEEHFSNLSIYPITLTFHQDDVPSLKRLDVFSFIRRVQTVVFEGPELMVIEAKNLETADVLNEATKWDIGIYEPNYWAWNPPRFLMEVLELDMVTSVKSIDLHPGTVDLVIELSWSVVEGHMNWTVKKTVCLKDIRRGAITSENVSALMKTLSLESLNLSGTSVGNVSALAALSELKFLDLSGTNVVDVSTLNKLTNLKSLNLRWTDVSVVSALAELINLEYLNLSGTKVVQVSALAKLTNLNSLDLYHTKVFDISALVALKKLKDLDLSRTNVVRVSALAKLTNLKSLRLSWTKVRDVSAFTTLRKLESLDLTGTKVVYVSALKSSLPNLIVRY
jgi:hypothetical protein